MLFEHTPDLREPSVLATAIALALAAAVSLGLSRFSYALLLPPMRADLGWSYLTAGAMNTINAAGYLAGALLTPGWLRRFGARRVFLTGGVISGVLLMAHATVSADAALYALRLATGIASAATFVGGGLLAARLSVNSPGSPSAGLVLGIYYGGTGVGIVFSALVVPALSWLAGAHAWRWAWVALGAAAVLGMSVTGLATRNLAQASVGPETRSSDPVAWTHFTYGLSAYFFFGLGYIGYMTFVVTLLREQQLGSGLITVFYALLGIAVISSSWIWAGLLQRHRGGGALAILNALLALATLLPVLSVQPAAVVASGLLFGGVFLSVVASTTALVRHNLPASAWTAGISAFTIVFAVGQIVGPTLVGWVADGAGGLRAGLGCSAAVLMLGALIACKQRPLLIPGTDR